MKMAELIRQQFGGMYGAIVLVRNTEVAVFWARFNVLGGLVVLLMTVAVANSDKGSVQRYWNFICALGIMLTIVWFVAVWVGRGLIRYWEKQLSQFESCIGLFTKVDQPEVTHDNAVKEIAFFKDYIDKMSRGLWGASDYWTRRGERHPLSTYALLVPIMLLVCWFYLWVTPLPTLSRDKPSESIPQSRNHENAVNGK